MINVDDTILAQYAQSQTLVGLIEAINSAIDPATNIDDFYQKIWDIETAESYGLDVWGKIVVQRRVLTQAIPLPYFGFAEDSTANGFGDTQNADTGGYFWDGDSNTLNGSTTLPDDIYRFVILAKAMKNINDCTMPGMNKSLALLFNDTRAFVFDTGGMTMRLDVERPITAVELALIRNEDILPRPAGVWISNIVESEPNFFGFLEDPFALGFGDDTDASAGGFFARQV